MINPDTLTAIATSLDERSNRKHIMPSVDNVRQKLQEHGVNPNEFDIAMSRSDDAARNGVKVIMLAPRAPAPQTPPTRNDPVG